MKRLSMLRRDDGFTLPELLIAIVITGIIASAVAASFIVVLRNHADQANRLSTSHDANLLSSRIWSDLQSTDTVVTSLEECPAGIAVSDGTVLELAWKDWSNWKPSDPVSVQHRVTYAAHAGELTRKHQVSSGTSTQTVVVHNLVDAKACISGSKVALTVKTEVTGDPSVSSEPYVFAVSGTRRVPAAVEPIAAGASTTPTPSTEPTPSSSPTPSPTPTPTPTPVCTITELSLDPASVQVNTSSGDLTDNVVVKFRASSCSGPLSVQYQYGDALQVGIANAPTGSGGIWTTTISKNKSGETWTVGTGSKTVSVRYGGVDIASVTLTVSKK